LPSSLKATQTAVVITINKKKGMIRIDRDTPHTYCYETSKKERKEELNKRDS
jgi:hypothetical protein